ncbi:MAG: hypothetical protein HS103_19470 [Anaerolineales bacterium]|nr:hypothetical protein [Anaerolineales bacterium]
MSNYRDDMSDYDDDGEDMLPAPRRPNPAQTPPPTRIPPTGREGDRAARQARPLPPPAEIPPQRRAAPADYTNAPPRRRPPAPPRRVSKRESGFYLPWWSLVVMLIFVGAAAVGAWIVVDGIGGNAPPGGKQPVVVIVTATFTVGPPPTPSPIPLPATELPPPILPTVIPTATLPPGNFTIGTTVEVVGVGIAGLNIRSGPGTESVIRFQAPEGSRWIIKSGPSNASGSEWWELQDPTNSERGGWGARPYLKVVE